jgi:hypothetical protein
MQIKRLGRSSTRRSFLRAGLASPGVIGAAVLGDPLPSAAFDLTGVTNGDINILRFLCALEIIENDLWQQYNELGGIQDSEVPGGSGNTQFKAGLVSLDMDMPQYIHDKLCFPSLPRMPGPIARTSSRQSLACRAASANGRRPTISEKASSVESVGRSKPYGPVF